MAETHSPTLDAADAIRKAGVDTLRAHELYATAGEEAKALIARLHVVVKLSGQRPSGVAPILANHLDEDGLTGSIYRHAMVHAGALIEKATQRPFEKCPQCGCELD